MDVKNEESPIRSLIKLRIDFLDLKKENLNLKRLLRLVKNHIIHNDELYGEIMDVLKK